jgi:hypothetical protein
VVPGFVTLTGHAEDRSTSGPISVAVYVDDDLAVRVNATTQWAADTPVPHRRRFVVDLPMADGPHRVCIAVAPDDVTTTDCIEVKGQTADPASAFGPVVLTAITPDPHGVVVVRGVDTRVGTDAPSHIAVSTTAGTVTDSDTASPITEVDVDNQAFRFRIVGLPAGRYAMCPSEIEISVYRRPLAPEVADGCATVVIDGANGQLHIGTTGLAITSQTVGPSTDHPLFLMERDAGVSVQLSDQSTLWFFGDTLMRGPNGDLRFFVNNTAAWATVDAPHTTRDAITADDEPALFAVAPEGTCAGARFPDPALWPESAVAIAQPDGTDRVVVVMSKVCIGREWLDIETVGYAIAEYIYDPAHPPQDQPVRGQLTQPDLASAAAGWGRAMFVHPDGFLYGYHCGEYLENWGPCQVGRVMSSAVTDVDAWRFWNGGDWRNASSWVRSVEAAAAMALPGAEEQMLPVAAFGVVFEARINAYLMVYTPWPGFCGQLAVRVAVTPVGPWSTPLVITLPECATEDNGSSGVCYAATPQMQLCEGQGFAGGYYNSLTELGVARYLTFVSPFEVTRTTR